MKVTLERIKTIAQRHDLEPALVAGFVEVESGFNAWAMRYEPAYRWLWPSVGKVKAPPGVSLDTEINGQCTSWGALQIMGAVARERGFRGPFFAELCEPEVGLEYGCRHIVRQLDRYDGDVSKAVSAYNAGCATDANARYVSKVLAARDVWAVRFE